MKNIFWRSINHNNATYFIFVTDKGICCVTTTLEKGEKWIYKAIGNCEIAEDNHNKILAIAVRELKSYLDGECIIFSGPFDLYGTEFQKKVWHNMTKINHGKTQSYKELALSVKNPKAVRAIGAACGANPVMIMIPCHRVIGSDGKLTGYAGGLSTKSSLLELEKNYNSRLSSIL
ncbi:MAG TPA: methylated-DNA--[protein]-cysteine S-methyltransferase [Candidatus Nitrosocosmicus sp.]|nr:methylated-DNA--[protein]-cysteine S-methyltransferase [Candidatus Nitrosocosmicus sp.]